MKVLCLLSVLFVAVNSLRVNEFNGKNWVVLVAGSNSWFNYRHQADVYHAYQIVKKNGIPDENIIVMHYDDIANNKANKFPGKVFNHPSHKDVYPGVPKDYTGKEVTPENFLKVLAGDQGLKNEGKKVLESGPNDHVFVFFDDHGAPDLVAFPNKYLYSDPLLKTLKQMHQDKKYGKLVFYIEACEAGSMFANLPDNINIYATTAANGKESSYAIYNDATVGTYLGDEYSVNWMENAEAAPAETLQQQFDVTKTKTKGSHVQHFGDLSIASLPISQFLGHSKLSVEVTSDDNTLVNNKDFPLVLAQQSADYQELSVLSTGRQFLDTVFEEYVNSIQHLMNANNDVFNTRLELNNRECYHNFVD
ncbi:unnamed protein product, partial [Medioppia subpectinata]